MTTTIYTVRGYNDGKAIGEIAMSNAEYAAYERDAQSPEGLIALSDLVTCGGEYTPSEVVAMSTTVYLD